MLKCILILTTITTISYSQNSVIEEYFIKNFQLEIDQIAEHQFFNLNEESLDLPILKPDFMVNDIGGDYGERQITQSIARSGNGNYAITWLDFRNGRPEIYIQFYKADDIPIGANLKVNDDILKDSFAPSLSVNENGNFVVTWRQNFYSVMSQKFNNEGQKIGINQPVTMNARFSNEICASTINSDGTYMVMWQSENYEQGQHIRTILMSNDGTPITGEMIVQDSFSQTSSRCSKRSVAIDSRGIYCLVWTTFDNIYLQRYDHNGLKLGSNVKVNTTTSPKGVPQIEALNDGHFLIAWLESNGLIVTRIYHSDNYFVNDETSLQSNSYNSSSLSITSDKVNNFFVFQPTWGQYAIRKISKDGLISDSLPVSFISSVPAYFNYVDMTSFMNDNFLFSFQGNDRNDVNVYCQKFSKEVVPLGTTKKVSDDFGSSPQWKPEVFFNCFGESIFIWEDNRNGRRDLYARVLDKNYNPLINNIRINETEGEYAELSDFTATATADGKFIIFFAGFLTENGSNIYSQIIGRSGNKIGSNIILVEDAGSSNKLTANTDTDGDILLCWQNYPGIYSRLFNSNMTPISVTRQLSSNPNYYNQNLSIDENNNALLIWWEYVNVSEKTQIFGQTWNKNGESISLPFLIDSTQYSVFNVNCQNDDTDIALLIYNNNLTLTRYYREKKSQFTNTLYGSIYNSFGNHILKFKNGKIFINYRRSDDVMGLYIDDTKRSIKHYILKEDLVRPDSQSFESYYSAAIFESNLLFSYDSNINPNTGTDIWANVKRIDDLDFSKSFFYPEQKQDFLYDNFPNPFNPATTIAYELLAFHKVKLTVYDILGREVKTLVNEYQEKGVYEVGFDASDLASGVYFYKLEAFDTTIKKMLLIK